MSFIAQEVLRRPHDAAFTIKRALSTIAGFHNPYNIACEIRVGAIMQGRAYSGSNLVNLHLP